MVTEKEHGIEQYKTVYMVGLWNKVGDIFVYTCICLKNPRRIKTKKDTNGSAYR